MITGCGGGVLRDILCNDIPLLFRKEIYATASLLTGIIFTGMLHLGFSDQIAAIAGALAGLILRLLSIHFKWQMPKFVYHEEWD